MLLKHLNNAYIKSVSHNLHVYKFSVCRFQYPTLFYAFETKPCIGVYMTTRWPIMKGSLSTHNELCVYILPHRLLHAKISIAQNLQSESIKHLFL